MFAKSFVAVLVALPFVAQIASADNCSRTYTVQPGDICDTISAANNVSTYQLAVVNHDNINPECSNLIPGEELCLGTAGEDCTSTYVVQPDDTCDLVISMAGINSTLLYLNNPQIDPTCSNLYIGEVICTAKQVNVPPAPAAGFAPSTPVTAIPANPTQNTSNGDDDDDDLPFCDEL